MKQIQEITARQRSQNKGDEIAVAQALLNDPDLVIDWQIPEELRIISDKDTKHPLLKDLDNPF